jgi:glutamine synthetase
VGARAPRRDIHDATYTKELSISNLANGYRDIECRIDFNTYRRIPFEDDIAFFLGTYLDPDTGKGLHACPRATLQKVVAQLDEELQVEPYAGAEYEFFQFKGGVPLPSVPFSLPSMPTHLRSQKTQPRCKRKASAT